MKSISETHRYAIPISIIAFSTQLCLAATDPPEYGAADRYRVAEHLYESMSAINISDQNGDSFVSDVDYSFALRDRLVEVYGSAMQPGDLDGDGYETAEDVIFAICAQLSLGLGKSDHTDPSAVGFSDIVAVSAMISANDPRADINFDSFIDSDDLSEVVAHYGGVIDAQEIDGLARDVYAYIDIMSTAGDSFFVFDEFDVVGGAHHKGISETWPPNHPKWWRDNHLTGVSGTYYKNYEGCDIGHAYFYSNSNAPPLHFWELSVAECPPHTSSVSKTWPANHYMSVSPTWRPQSHSSGVSEFGPPAPHAYALSKTFPPGHRLTESRTWTHNQGTSATAHHDATISRTWWANHTRALSQAFVFPPTHLELFSETWIHNVEVSSTMFPPNHLYDVSAGWGPAGHQFGVSSYFPPSHVADASSSWPGPQNWPPGHSGELSAEWWTPAPGPWPIFPPGHSWWTTFGGWIPNPSWPFPSIPAPETQ